LPNFSAYFIFYNKSFEILLCFQQIKIFNFTVEMAKPSNDTKTITSEDTGLLTLLDDPCSLILWNDDVNTFEWVIETLIEVCGHSEEQAEQCAYIVHFKGKCSVKNGSYDELKPLCNKITERGIGATVEVTV